MRRKSLLSIAFVLLGCLWSFAQNIAVKGTVKDNRGEPLPGVSVLVKGTTQGTTTSLDGNYALNAPQNGTLLFTYIGFETKEVAINNQTTVNITLAEANTQLNEVVVVGYGSQKKGDITGSVGVVSAEAFENRPNTQMSNMLEGKTSGVQVLSSSGKPSAGLSMRIRGTSSINSSSEPLYVVDGVPTGDTRSLNPADIESISVLKDAASAAIYGAQGANGVVLITTKKGKTANTKFDFTAYTGFSKVWRKLDVLNGAQYQDLMTEMGQNTDWSLYTANTNWQDEVFQNGASQNYQLAISGKNEKTSYYISGGWVQQKGAVRSSEMDRYNFKVNLDQKVNNWLNVGTNLAYTRYHDVNVNDNAPINSGGVILGVISTPPVIGIYNPDGTFTRNPFQDWENPISSTDGTDRGYKNQRLLGNAYGEITFFPGLKFKSNIGIDYSNAANDSFLDPIRSGWGRANGGIASYGTNLSNFWITDNTLTYSKLIGKHNFSALAGMVFQKYRWENSSIERRNFSGIAVTTPNGGSIINTANADKAEKANQSFISRLTYDFANKYLFQANFRADASSAFGPGNKWGYFPSFSAGWRISEEPFFDNINVINDLKLKASWGIVGNDQIGNYAHFALVSPGANYLIGPAILPGTYPSTIGNSDLKWEETTQTNVGLDVALLNSRINFSAEAYLKKTNDLLLNLPLPRSTGFDNGLQNVGSVENRGLEFQINSRNFVKKNFQWETDFNISFNRNKVLSVVGQEIAQGGVASRGDAVLIKEGYPLGMFYGYVADIVDPQTGDLLYLDANGNSTANPAASDRRFIGNPNPDFIYGFTNTFTYKNFGLNIFLQGSQGNDILNATRIDTEGMVDPKNQSADVLRRWTTPGQVTDIPRAEFGVTDNSRISTRFIENGSYLRVKSATLSFDVPKSLLNKAKIGSARLYVTGENLLTFTDYKGFDPEVNSFGGSNTVQGVDFGTYPQTRNLIFGLNVSF
ncbi:SusC/RagA family TonB-linked outer membrane protein [Rubrolithibacter danxiaensis]|uniref:SusC/RagA family TonB-linked outer membrane protein n=1 Tax=Rubrolithibacter danxiaensis TaxID=3390805 RepID=UPI003BF8649E